MLRSLALLLALVCHSLSVRAATEELVILNWADYLDPGVVAEFEAAFDVTVKQIYYESDAERDKIMVKEEGRGFDLVVLDKVAVSSYARRGWLAPLPAAGFPNLRHLEPHWQHDHLTLQRYGVPYFWGTTGLAYRADLVAEPIHSWMQVFRPRRELHGRIIMINDARDLIGMALKALGHSQNSEDAAQLQQAEALLLEQRPYVRRYGYLLLTESSALMTGAAHVSMAYSGDALALQALNPDIKYVVPEEGGALWTDYLALTASGKQALAARFIDFLNRPGIAARNAEYVYYATPNQAALERLGRDYRDHPVIFPDARTLARCESNQALPPRVLRRYNMVYSRVVDGGRR